VIHKPNSGICATRNAGYNQASGEYVCFVDHDDILHPRYVEYLLKACLDNSVDMSVCQHTNVRDKQQIDLSDVNYEATVWHGADMMRHANMGYIWNKMYQKDVIKNNLFDESLVIAEDVCFMNALLKKLDSCAVIQGTLYFYRKNGLNITSHLKASSYKIFMDVFYQWLDNSYVKKNPDLSNSVWQSIACYAVKYYVALQEEKMEGWKKSIKQEQKKYKTEYVPNLKSCSNKVLRITNVMVCLPSVIFRVYLKMLSVAKRINNKRKIRSWEN
jgi:glycosyltransferase involved in cell wall biosynthesis